VVELPGVQGLVQGGPLVALSRPLVAPVCAPLGFLWTSLDQPLDSALPDVSVLMQRLHNHSRGQAWAACCPQSGTSGTSAFELRVQGLEQGEQPGSDLRRLWCMRVCDWLSKGSRARPCSRTCHHQHQQQHQHHTHTHLDCEIRMNSEIQMLPLPARWDW
jgi:hypothetical protein